QQWRNPSFCSYIRPFQPPNGSSGLGGFFMACGVVLSHAVGFFPHTAKSEPALRGSFRKKSASL
ncbi:hypothetical protein, partial [Trichlorobacter lovleyi]|uniref:hypothetical protein n=1 Tax=Trichlorobacter lovleyi TaxID=313985 RepID=UPI003D0E7B7B